MRLFPKRNKNRKALNGEAEVKRPPVPEAADQYSDKDLHEVCHGLQKSLKRPVILTTEGRLARFTRKTAKNRRAILGLGAVGVGIASVATAGVAAAVLAVVAVGLPAVADLPAVFGAEMLDANPVFLTREAARALHSERDEQARVKAVLVAIEDKRASGEEGAVTLDVGDIVLNGSAPKPVPHVHAGPAQVGLRMGITVVGAGLLLLALTIIPQDIHGLMTRAASVLLVVGALIVGRAVADGTWFKGAGVVGRGGKPGRDGL